MLILAGKAEIFSSCHEAADVLSYLLRLTHLARVPPALQGHLTTFGAEDRCKLLQAETNLPPRSVMRHLRCSEGAPGVTRGPGVSRSIKGGAEGCLQGRVHKQMIHFDSPTPNAGIRCTCQSEVSGQSERTLQCRSKVEISGFCGAISLLRRHAPYSMLTRHTWISAEISISSTKTLSLHSKQYH